jgi:hypothetical protein
MPKFLENKKIRPPKKKTSERLNNIGDVRLEMARVYYEMRKGIISIKDGNGLIYALVQIRQTIEIGAIEPMIEKLEAESGAAAESAGIFARN